MTSASELFSRRRSARVDRNNDTPELGLGSSIDRNLHNHHTHNRRSRHLQRRDLEDCDPVRRPSGNSRHICHREHEPVRLDHVASQSNSGNNISRSNTGNNISRGASSGTANRLQISRNGQLPGAVLLARERLVERLRGVSLTANRQGRRMSLGMSWDDFANGDDFRLVDAGDWETETSGEWPPGGTALTDSSTQTDLFSSGKKRPPGLSQEEINHLHREVFSLKEKDDDLVLSMECCICLDKFQVGDGLTHLSCGHKFHSACLDPWVRICGDCPYCRTGVVSNHHEIVP